NYEHDAGVDVGSESECVKQPQYREREMRHEISSYNGGRDFNHETAIPCDPRMEDLNVAFVGAPSQNRATYGARAFSWEFRSGMLQRRQDVRVSGLLVWP